MTDETYCLGIDVTNAQTNSSTLLINSLTSQRFSNTVCLASSKVTSVLLNNVIFSSVSTSTISLHLTANNISVASASKSVNILESPHSPCNNVDCDSCSYTSNGEYCFACREGMISY